MNWGDASALAVAAALEHKHVEVLDPDALATPWNDLARLAKQTPLKHYGGNMPGFVGLLTPGWLAGVGIASKDWVADRLWEAQSSMNGTPASEYMDRARKAGQALHWNAAADRVLKPEDGDGSLKGRLHRIANEAGLETSRGGPVIVAAGDIDAETVTWWWPGRIGLGKLTVIEGDPDVGKSTVLLDLAARITRGAPMPDDTPAPDGPGGVLILAAAEDGVADTIVPRLDAAGADLDRVHIWQGTPTETPGYLRGFEITEADLAGVERIVAQHGVRLVVIDALMAAIPTGTDGHRDTDLRRVLHPLAAMAERTGCAVIANRHHKKGGGRAMDRGGGSIAVNAVARATLAVVRDPDDETGERRILGIVKANLLAQADRASIAFRITGAQVTNKTGAPIDTSRIEWLGKDTRTLDEILALGDDRERATITNDCAAALRELLADGPIPADEATAALRREDFTPSAIRRARHIAGVTRDNGTIYRTGYTAGNWMWALTAPGDPTPRTNTRGSTT